MISETPTSDFLSDLSARGLIHEMTPKLGDALRAGPVTGYIGFDPTASSLHVGSLLPILALARLQHAGHHPIALAGGGTGLIGDPSGKTAERQLLTIDKVRENLTAIQAQLARFLDFDTPTNPARLVDNHDWLGSLNLLDFLRDTGKHFKVNVMLKRDSVARRLAAEDGISFTEFSYQLLQAYDFSVLFERYGCALQMGGSDQWGNIVAGIDLIGRTREQEAHALVMPLLTTATGAKFGKTEAGTVWLDPQRTSPYAYYQFWFNATDDDARRYLRFFTFLPLSTLAEIDAAQAASPAERLAQRTLAEELTRLTHGAEALARAQRISRSLFGEEVSSLSAEDVLEGIGEVPSAGVERSSLEGEGAPLLDLIVGAGLAASKGEGRRLVTGGGLYLNNRRIADPNLKVGLADVIGGSGGSLLLFRKGRKDYHLLRVTP